MLRYSILAARPRFAARVYVLRGIVVAAVAAFSSCAPSAAREDGRQEASKDELCSARPHENDAGVVAIDIDSDGRADTLHGSVLAGARRFFEPSAHGNGRSCATCHVPSDHFALTPQHAEQRYQALLAKRRSDPCADDALFRPLDADDGADDYTLLRTRALIKVRIPLPTWIKLKSDPAATHVTVLRGVPSVRNVKNTAPYQIDGRLASLEDQALAALHDHSQITRAPPATLLGELAAFERALFTSPSLKRHSDALALDMGAPDPDPPLNNVEERGKERFIFFCAGCHGGESQSRSTDKRWFEPFDGTNIAVFVSNSTSTPPAGGSSFPESPIHAADRALPMQTFVFTLPDGSQHEVSSSDPGAALHDQSSLKLNNGFLVINRFDPPQLRGIRHTAPYFHANNAYTLREVLQHYQKLFHFVGVVRGFPVPQMPDDDLELILAYLQRI